MLITYMYNSHRWDVYVGEEGRAIYILFRTLYTGREEKLNNSCSNVIDNMEQNTIQQ